ncbi:MAG: hypothetical protein AB1566_15430 [Chloroflexota bacterium]
MREIRTLRSTGRGLETWRFGPLRQPSTLSRSEVDGTIPLTDLLRFTPEEVFASYACGERVLDFARTSWNWQALEEMAAQPIN